MKKLLLVIIMLWSVSISAQGEAANWYFGFNAAIEFNQGGVNTLNDNVLRTNEGSATISDPGGNLLFYTDGRTVYNRNHQMMLNGDNLLGDPSSSQSAIIVPKPGDINIYYIFTVDREFEFDGLNYSEVDIRLDNGLGAVTQKNINLLGRSAEKVSVVLRDCFDGSLWVVSFASENGNSTTFNTYHAFQIDNNGVNPVSVRSTFNNININDPRGYLKFSPDGTRLASANASEGLFIYDFNPLTGIVSNQLQLSINNISNAPYGIEFSPNSQALYVHASNDFFGAGSNSPLNHTSTLTQFDLTAVDIQASEFTLDDRQLFRGALQLGIDGRIYRALSSTFNLGTSFLGVINNPDVLGNGANYQHDAIDLSPNLSSQGLPPFNQSLFTNRIDIIRNGISATRLDLCLGETFTLMGNDISGAEYTWSLDGVVIANETTFQLPIDSNQLGIGEFFYELLIDPNNGDCPIIGQALVVVSPGPEANDTILIQCDEDGILGGFNRFDLTLAIDDITNGEANRTVQFYNTRDDAENDVAEITGMDLIISTDDLTQTFFARVSITTAGGGCFGIAEILLDVSLAQANDAELMSCDDSDGVNDGFSLFNLTEANDAISMEPNLTFTYYLTRDEAILASTPPLPNTFSNTAPNQTIFVRVENADGCLSINEVDLIVITPPDVMTEEVVEYCEFQFPETITLDAGLLSGDVDDFTYLWSTGETTPEIEVNQTGTFTVLVTSRDMCSILRTITVIPQEITVLNDPIEIEVIDVSSNNVIIINVQGNSNYEYALDNINGPYQDSNRFENVEAGFHIIFIRDINNCSIAQREVSVIRIPDFFTPNGDSIFDRWQVIGLSENFQPRSTIFIFDRYGKLLKQLDPLGPGWDGTFNGRNMPTNDYWYRVTLEDGRIFRGHFTLKR